MEFPGHVMAYGHHHRENIENRTVAKMGGLDDFPEECSFPERHHVVRSISLNISMGASFTIQTNKQKNSISQ